MKVVKIVFSPTGGTQKVADILAVRLASELECPSGDIESIDLTDPFLDEGALSVPRDAACIIAMPCFGGRAPEVAIRRLSRIDGSGSKAVVVNVYGNRDFDDALLEMEDSAKAAGFDVVAAIAAIAEHSIMHQFATGRPDEADIVGLEDFAYRIAKQIAIGESTAAPRVPGNDPYLKAGAVPLVPKVTSKCVSCGKCAESCPVTSINSVNFATDKDVCIACMRCIAICPQSARSISKLMVKAASMAIKKTASVRKEAKLFI